MTVDEYLQCSIDRKILAYPSRLAASNPSPLRLIRGRGWEVAEQGGGGAERELAPSAHSCLALSNFTSMRKMTEVLFSKKGVHKKRTPKSGPLAAPGSAFRDWWEAD